MACKTRPRRPLLTYYPPSCSEDLDPPDREEQGIARSSSLNEFLRTESSSTVARKNFSMRKLKETMTATRRSGARRERARQERNARRRYITEGSPDIVSEDDDDCSYSNHTRSYHENKGRRERSRRSERRTYELSQLSDVGDAPPHPSTLLEVPEDDLETWLDEGLPANQGRASKSFRIDQEAQEKRRPVENFSPALLIGGLVVVCLVAGISVFIVTEGGSKTDIFTTGLPTSKPVGESMQEPTAPPPPPVLIMTTPLPSCKRCTMNVSFEGCFFNTSVVSTKASQPAPESGQILTRAATESPHQTIVLTRDATHQAICGHNFTARVRNVLRVRQAGSGKSVRRQVKACVRLAAPARTRAFAPLMPACPALREALPELLARLCARRVRKGCWTTLAYRAKPSRAVEEIALVVALNSQ